WSYIKRDRWLELWQQVTKNPLITQVDVRKVRSLKENRIFEIAKYSAKDSDYLQNQKVFEVFYKALKGKRLIVFSGLFKERSEEHTSELQSRFDLVCRLLLEK